MERTIPTVSDTQTPPENGDSESSEKRLPESATNSSSLGYQPLSELIEAHLTGCAYCKPNEPIGLGQKPRLCSEYWRILQEWSDNEGRVNNIVAHDEYGNEAPRSADPRKYNDQWRL